MRNNLLILIFTVTVQLEFTGLGTASDDFRMLNLQVGDQRYTGRVLKHNEESCWLLARDGRLQQFAIKNVSTFSEVNDRFKAHLNSELKKQLQAEFDKSFEVHTSNHYVVVARRGSAESYAVVFEQIYRDFMRTFRARGFQLENPEFPMIAIVFKDEVAFAKYCRDEQARIQPGLVGFYLSTSNRVALYERQNPTDIYNTVVHEATHQIAFNTGIHSRLAKHPKWAVEGLATVFEADGIRSRQGTSSPADRTNRERYLWFVEYMNTRRPPHSLTNFLSDDEFFDKSTLDGYSEAWALSFFLIEVHSAGYFKYLKQLVDRDPLAPYDATSRLNDFKNVFGTDIDGFETSYLRFIKRIADR